MNRLNKENIPPNNYLGARGVLRDKTNKMGNDSFLKRTHSMDVHQKNQSNVLSANLMNVENIDHKGPSMDMEELSDTDKFDRANKHNPQMVSVFARQIFDYLREREVDCLNSRSSIFPKKDT